jgi:tRNA pseudouridine(55) synthase
MKYVWKFIGETPLEAIQRYRGENKITERMCFVGRLDPMAQGVLPILVGEEMKRMEEYLHNEKTYTAEAVLGVSTDTYDPMGVVSCEREVSAEETELFVAGLLGLRSSKIKQDYPPYSSFHVEGEPLWLLAKTGRLPDPLPSKEVEIREVEVEGVCCVKLEDYIDEIEGYIKSVKGDFRQSEILDKWRTVAISHLTKVKFKIRVSSGTYIRSIVHNLIKGIPAHANLITRIEVHS